MEPCKTQNCNPEAEEKRRKNNSSRLQTILPSYSNQNFVILARKQTYGSMEQKRELRKKPTHLQSINVQQRRQEYKIGKRQSLQQVVLAELDSCIHIPHIHHTHTYHKHHICTSHTHATHHTYTTHTYHKHHRSTPHTSCTHTHTHTLSTYTHF